MIGDAIFAQAAGNAGLTALIGTEPTRFFPGYDLQRNRAYPLCVYKLENAAEVQNNDGGTGLYSADLVIAAIDSTYAATKTLAKAVTAAFNMQKGTWNGTVVQGCFLKEGGIEDDVVTNQESEDILYFVKRLTFEIWFVW